MMDERRGKRIESADGQHYVEIVTRDGGIFRFVEHTQMTDSGYTFWTPTHWSGLYGDAQSAEREAQITIGWLRDQISN
jgi:hypothetical protein